MDIKQEEEIDDQMDKQVLIKQELGDPIEADLYKHPCEVKMESSEQYNLSTTSVSSLIKSEKEEIEIKCERLEPFEDKSEKPEPVTSELEMEDREQYDPSTNTVRSMFKSEERTAVKTEKLEPEDYMDMAEFIDASQLTDELDVKSEHDPDTDIAPDAKETSAAEKECPRDLGRLKKRNVLYCYYCEFTAYSKSSLISHIRTHRNHTLKPFKRKTSLDNHVIGNYSNLSLVDTKVHKSRKRSNNSCVHCDATFVRKVSLRDHIKRHHPEFTQSVISKISKIHQCTNCTYKTINKACFNKHQLIHMPPRTCKYCDAKFSRTVLLDNHIIKKHPNFTSTVTSKLYECTKCTYKTVRQRSFASHIMKHPETIRSDILRTCEHCYETFANKISLENHIVKNHPDFLQSVTSKLYECTKCAYKTVRKGSLATHKLTHPETASSDMFKSCIYCDALFKSKPALDNHVLKKHPDFVKSVTSKVYECTYCSYKAIKKRDFTRHVKTHPVITSSDTPSSRFECLHCDATFVDKFLLDDHVIKKHPDYMASVTSMVHECKECTYKTTRKSNFTMHMLRHAAYQCKKCQYRTTKRDSLADHMLLHLETTDSRKRKTCRHCNSVFKTKRALDDHILKKHPDFIDSVTNTVYKCSDCTYRCTKKGDITIHIKRHSDTITAYLQCVHCNTVPFSDQLSLDNHIIKRHPELITSVTSEIYECTKCTFKTVRKKNLTAHMLRHREISSYRAGQ